MRSPRLLHACFVDDDGRIQDDARRRESFVERGRVDKGFETRTRLAPRLSHPVEFALKVIEAADQGDHGAVLRVHRHESTLCLRHLYEQQGLGRPSHRIDHIAPGQDLRGLSRRAVDFLIRQFAPRPGELLPGQRHRSHIPDVDLCALGLDILNDGGPQAADHGEFLELRVEVLRARELGEIDLGGRAAKAVAAIVFQQPRAQRDGSRRLQARIDGGKHLVAGCVDGIAVLGLHFIAHHLGQVRGIRLDRGAVQPRFHGGEPRLVVFRLGDVAELEHSTQHMSATDPGGLGIGHGIDHGGGGRNPRQGGHFSDGQLVQSLAEIHLRRGANPVGALAEEDLVDVQRENLFLGELGLHQERNVDFAHFSLHIAPRRQKHVAGDLHGDRARPLADAAGFEVGHRRPQNPLPINAMVTEEAIILGGQKRLDELLGELFVADRDPALLTDGSEQLPVPGVNPQGNLQLDVPQAFHVG